MRHYDGQIYARIPALQIGAAVQEWCVIVLLQSKTLRPPIFTLQYLQQFIIQ